MKDIFIYGALGLFIAYLIYGSIAVLITYINPNLTFGQAFFIGFALTNLISYFKN